MGGGLRQGSILDHISRVHRAKDNPAGVGVKTSPKMRPTKIEDYFCRVTKVTPGEGGVDRRDPAGQDTSKDNPITPPEKEQAGAEEPLEGAGDGQENDDRKDPAVEEENDTEVIGQDNQEI